MNYELFKKTNENGNNKSKSYIIVDSEKDEKLYNLLHKLKNSFDVQNMCKTILSEELGKIK